MVSGTDDALSGTLNIFPRSMLNDRIRGIAMNLKSAKCFTLETAFLPPETAATVGKCTPGEMAAFEKLVIGPGITSGTRPGLES